MYFILDSDKNAGRRFLHRQRGTYHGRRNDQSRKETGIHRTQDIINSEKEDIDDCEEAFFHSKETRFHRKEAFNNSEETCFKREEAFDSVDFPAERGREKDHYGLPEVQRADEKADCAAC